MVNGWRAQAAVLLLACVVLTAAAWLRGAEYDEQYTLFLTAGTPRPAWPDRVMTAAEVVGLQTGTSAPAAIARHLRETDVHPPLYFWAAAAWRTLGADGLFATRMLSVSFSLVSLVLVAALARQAGVPPALAMLLVLGCYGFVYTGIVARGFALADVLTLGGLAVIHGDWPRHRVRRGAIGGVLLGAATLTNYLAVFVAVAGITGLLVETCTQLHPWQRFCARVLAKRPSGRHHEVPSRHRRHARPWEADAARLTMPQPVQPWVPGPGPGTTHMAVTGTALLFGTLAGFAVVLPADAWFYLAQRGSRTGQFPPFELAASLRRLAQYGVANLVGGLPLYVGDALRPTVAVVLTGLVLALFALVGVRWRHIGTPSLRRLLAFAVAAPPVGLLAIGLAFDSTPIELRYLAFATPFAALLLAGANGSLPRPVARPIAIAVLSVQALALAGLMVRPETMQPAQATARATAAAVGDGIVLVPFGNDGVGIVGAFAREAPATLPFLVIRRGTPPQTILIRIEPYRRVTLALLAQDADSRATVSTLMQIFATPIWRRVAEGSNFATYERTCDGAPDVLRGIHDRETRSAAGQDPAAPRGIGAAPCPAAWQSADPCDVAPRGADAGEAFHGDLPGPARLRLFTETAGDARPCALRQERDGEGRDRGDGHHGP